MMRSITVSKGELTATEIIDIIENGGRVLIESSVLGDTIQVAIRKHKGTYYCDTPTKLNTYTSPEKAATCLESHQLVRTESG